MSEEREPERNMEFLEHEQGLLLHDMRRLEVNTGKLPLFRRTTNKRKEVIEEMTEIYMSAVQLEDEIKAHPAYPTSDYKDDSYFPAIERAKTVLLATCKRVFADAEEEVPPVPNPAGFLNAASAAITAPSGELRKFEFATKAFVKDLRKESARLRGGTPSVPMLTSMLRNAQRKWKTIQGLLLEVELLEQVDETTKARAMLVKVEKLRDEFEEKGNDLIDRAEDLRKLKFKPIDPPTFSGRFRDWPKFRRAC